MGGKLFAVIVIVIALASAIPIVTHTVPGRLGHASRGHLDAWTMLSTNNSPRPWWRRACLFLPRNWYWFLCVEICSNRKQRSVLRTFPAAPSIVIVAALLLVGSGGIALGVLGTKAWGKVYFSRRLPDALPIQAQAGQFAFYFRYPGPDGKFGGIHPDKIDEGNSNFFGLDPAQRCPARDDIIIRENWPFR